MSSKNIPVKIEFGGVDNITPVLGSINLRISDMTKKFDVLNQTTKKIDFKSRLMSGVLIAQNMRQFTSGMRQAATSSIQDMSNIEDNINRLGILMHKEGDTKFFESQKKQWRELSQVSRYTQSEISDVAKEIANSGVHDEDFMRKLTDLSIKLADASKNELSAVEAFQTLNEFKNTFKIKAHDLGTLTDKIVYGKDQGTASYHDILEGFKYAAPVVSSVTNAKTDEFMALNAVLANHGIKGSVLGTALRRLPIQLMPSLDKKFLSQMELENGKEVTDIIKGMSGGHNELLKMLHLTPDKIQSEDGKIDLNKALIQMKSSVEKYTPSEQATIMKQLFGQEAISTGMTLKNFLDDYFNILEKVKTQSSGKSDLLANSTRNTLASKIEQSKNAWQNFKISVMDAELNDFLKGVLDQFKGLLVSLNALSPSTKSFIGGLGLLGYGMTELSAKIMPLMLNLYLMYAFFTSSAFLAGLNAVTLGIRALSVSLLSFAANPYVWLIAGILVALAAIGYGIYKIYENWEKIKDSFQNGFEKFVSFISKPIERLKEFIGLVEKINIGDPFDKLKNGVSKSWEAIKHKVEIDTKEVKISDRVSGVAKENRENKGSADITLSFNNLPQGTSIIQKTKNMNPVNLSVGKLGASYT